MLTLNDFAVRQIFNRADDGGGNPVYWVESESGYILAWPNGESHHTNKHPINYSGLKEWPWEY